MQPKTFIIDGNLLERQGFMKKLKQTLGAHDLFVFDDVHSFDFASQMITELNLFDEKHRLFVFNGLPFWPQKIDKSDARAKVIAGFIKVIPVIPLGNTVVFNNICIGAKKFVDAVKAHGEVHVFPQKVDKGFAKSKVMSFFGRREKTIEPEHADLLSNMLSDNSDHIDLDVLYLSLLKMEQYIGSRIKITQEDISMAFESSEKYVIWNVYRLMDDRKYCEAIRAVLNYLDIVSDVKGEILELFASMIWRYGGLLCIKSASSINSSNDFVMKEASSVYKLDREGKYFDLTMSYKLNEETSAKISMYSHKMIEGVINGWGRSESLLESFSHAHLSFIYYALVQAYGKIRVGCTYSEMFTSLQLCMMLICRKDIKNREDVKALGMPEIQQLDSFLVDTGVWK